MMHALVGLIAELSYYTAYFAVLSLQKCQNSRTDWKL